VFLKRRRAQYAPTVGGIISITGRCDIDVIADKAQPAPYVVGCRISKHRIGNAIYYHRQGGACIRAISKFDGVQITVVGHGVNKPARPVNDRRALQSCPILPSELKAPQNLDQFGRIFCNILGNRSGTRPFVTSIGVPRMAEVLPPEKCLQRVGYVT
jgi:hypothetical protein